MVVGGGVGGLATALALGRAGHQVTVLERDRPAGRRRRRGGVRRRAAGRAAGRTRPTASSPASSVDAARPLPRRARRPARRRVHHHADHRRPRRARSRATRTWRCSSCAAPPSSGCCARRSSPSPASRSAPASAVAGLSSRDGDRATASPSSPASALDDGAVVDADVVVAATGRRQRRAGVAGRASASTCPRRSARAASMYLSRWYRLPPGATSTLDPKLGGDLGFVKYLGVPGDGDTLSVTLAVRTDDGELRPAPRRPRSASSRPAGCCRAPTSSSPTGPSSRSAACGRWAACSTGSAASSTTTAARRCSASTPSATPTPAPTRSTAGAARWRWCRPSCSPTPLADHPDDAVGPGRGLRGGVRAARSSPGSTCRCRWTASGADPAGRGSAAAPLRPRARAMAAVFVAAATDPVIGRALARFWNLLATAGRPRRPTPSYVARMAEVMADPDAYPLPAARRPDPGRAARGPDASPDRARRPEALAHGDHDAR